MTSSPRSTLLSWRRPLAALTTAALLLTGPAGPVLEASASARDVWAERRERRLNRGRESTGPSIAPLALLPFSRKNGIVSEEFQPFASKPFPDPEGSGGIPLILHLQEIHGNAAAQKNAAKLLAEFARRVAPTGSNKSFLVAVEGAWGELDTGWFRSLSDSAYRDSLAQVFLRAGWMTGEEFLSVSSDGPPVRVVGAEDAGLFRANRRARKETADARGAMGGILAVYSAAISNLKSRILPPLAARLVDLKEGFERGRMDLTTYLRELDSAGSSPWARPAFPSLSNWLETEKIERRPETGEIRRRLAKALALPPTAGASPLSPQDSERLAFWANRAASLNPELIRRDLGRLEDQRLLQKVRSLPAPERRDATDFLRLEKWLRLNERLWSLEMSPEEWEELQTLSGKMGWESFHRDLSALCGKRRVSSPTEFTARRLLLLDRAAGPRLLDFYRLARQRDRAMARHAVALARSQGNGFAALVTGGFHSPGVRRWLRWEPASYLEWTPRLEEETASQTLRDASRFQLDPSRVPLSALVAAMTILHHPERWREIERQAPPSLDSSEIFESEGKRCLAGLGRGEGEPVPFLLGGTPEEPELIEGREALLALQRSRASTDRRPDAMDRELSVLLSGHPRLSALRLRLARGASRVKNRVGVWWSSLPDISPAGVPFPPLFRDPLFQFFFSVGGGALYFLPTQTGASRGNTRGDPGPSDLMQQALGQIRRGAFPEADKTLRLLHAVDLDDHWSDELFRQLSPDERARAGKNLSLRVWSAALNGHFTRLFEEHAAFLTDQYRTATEFFAAGGQRLPGMEEHLQKAKNTLSIFNLNARSPDIPADALHGNLSLQHNQAQASPNGTGNSWGWFCAEFDRLLHKDGFNNEDAKLLANILKFERKWLAHRLRYWLHPLVTQDPAGARWAGDDFLLPSAYGEYRHIQNFFPETAPLLQNGFEARRRCARERVLGVLTDLTGSPPQRPVDIRLITHPAIEGAVDRAAIALIDGAVRVQHPWPHTTAPFEQALAARFRKGTDGWGPRKLWRINLGQMMRTPNGTAKRAVRLSDLLVSLGEAGGNAVVLDLAEFEELFRAEPDALADAVQNLRQAEQERGVPGPERTLIFFSGSKGSRDPLASRRRTATPIATVEAAPDLVLSILKARADRMKKSGVESEPDLLHRLVRAVNEGSMDLPMADGLLDRAGAHARARAGAGLARVENGDLDLEQKGLPPFEHLSLWRQAGIALHAMAADVGTELEQYLNELRRTPPSDFNHSPLLAYIRHLLALRFLWPRTPATPEQDQRMKRTPQEQTTLLQQWRAKRKTFRDELDRFISGQNELKAELERTYLLHDFQQSGNPAPDPADMVLLEGPPGTGKTTIAQALAKATGRKFIEINAGGTADAKRWKGIKRTFVGSQPSEITRQLEEAGTEDVLILIDEVDKMSREALDALTDFLDKRQEYHDTYLGSRLRYRRPRVRVLLTANQIDEKVFPDHLLSRLRRVFTRRYTDKELIAIGLDHVFPETVRLTDFGEKRVPFPDRAAVIRTLVSEYLPGKDVRDLQKFLRRLLSQAFHEWLLASQPGRPAAPVLVDPAFVRRVLGAAPVRVDSIPSADIVGQVSGLAAGAQGGAVAPVQAYFRSLPGEDEGELIVTGLMKTDMRDSAQRAVLSVQQALGEAESIGRTHFHIPGEFPKSGPSAGLAFTTALYSERTGWPVRAGVAMTGEISPTGKTQRIGGLEEKLSAALRAGVNTVFLPAGNEPELRVALARGDLLRFAVENGNRIRLHFPENAWGHWLEGTRAEIDAFITAHPETSPLLTCVLVHHSYEVLNRAIVRPPGQKLLEVPQNAEPAGQIQKTKPPMGSPESEPEIVLNSLSDINETPAPPSPVGPEVSSMDEVNRLAFHSSPEERTPALQRLLASKQDEDARRVLNVLHGLASVGDPSFVATLRALPAWRKRLSAAARETDLQALGVLTARARDAVVEEEIALLRQAIEKTELWLTATPQTSGDYIQQARTRWTNQRQRAAQSRDELGGNAARADDYRFFDHVHTFLTQLLDDLPTSKTAPSFEDNQRFLAAVNNYLAFMRHQFNDFPGPTASATRPARGRELPFVTPISDLEQENALSFLIADLEHGRPSSDVSVTALAAMGENALRLRMKAGEVMDHTRPPRVPLTERELSAFRPAAEELARRLSTEDSRSIMVYSPDEALSARFLNAAAHYFQRTSPFPDQRATRVLSVTFPAIVGDPKILTTRLQETISQARAAGDVVLAVDLDAFSRHFNNDLATPMAFLIDTASGREGPQGAILPAPLLFFGKEETHLALTDTSLPYDRAVQSTPLLPSKGGAFLAEWLTGQVVDRLGPVPFKPAAQASLAELLERESDLDLSLVLSALLKAAVSARSGGSAAVTAEDVNRAVGEALASAERAPENIEEYRAAARRIPDPVGRRRLMSEISRLARIGAGADQQMLTTWIETVLAWPWREKPLPLISPDQIPDLVRAAMAKLDREVYGMKDIKQEVMRIYELYLHQISQGREPDMPIIALSGPPGTAKTHLARLIGEIFGLPSEVIACSGVDDPRHFVGFFRTYTSSEEGSIVKAYRKTKTKRMVLVFDELDKRRVDGHFGDPLNALTRFFDPKYRRFTDDFLELSLDVSPTLTVITMNRLETIPEHLQSRMTILKVEKPTREDKIGMANQVLLPRLLRSKGLTRESGAVGSEDWTPPVTIGNSLMLLTRLVDHHLSPLDDARKIEERLNQLIDSAFGDYVETGRPVRLDADALERYLGPPRGPRGTGEGPGETEVGRMEIPVQEGALMTTHAVRRPGAKWRMQLPLSLGDREDRPNTLADTGRLAWNLALSFAQKRFPNALPGTVYLHVDVNDASTENPGMGFSGLGLLAAFYSSITGQAPPAGVCLGGEIDLKGNVLPVNPKEHGTLSRKVIRSFAEEGETFYLPAGDGTRRELETMMRRQPYLRGLLLQNGVAELTLNSDPGTGDPADDGPAARRRQQEADLWNRLLEGLPAKAKAEGVEVSQEQIPLEEIQGLKQTGKESAFIQSFTLRGSEKDLTRLLSREEALRSIGRLKDETPKNASTQTLPIFRWLRGLMDKIQDGATPERDEKRQAVPLRFVLVDHVEEVLNDLFPDEGGPSSASGSTTGKPPRPSDPGNGSPSEFRAGMALSPHENMSFSADGNTPWGQTDGAFFAPTPRRDRANEPKNTLLAAVRILGENSPTESPLGALASQLERTAPLAPLTHEQSDRLADELGTIPFPAPGSDVSREEWSAARTTVIGFIERFPRPAPNLSPTPGQEARPTSFHNTLAAGLLNPENPAGLVIVDWGMVASSPKEVARLITSMANRSNNKIEIGFLNAEGEGTKMMEQLQKEGFSRGNNVHVLDRRALEEAGALLEGGRVDLKKVEGFVQTHLHRQNRAPARLSQVVADPVNARRYIGDVVRLLLDVEEVVLEGDAAVALVTSLGHDATLPIRTQTLSYNPFTRTLRLPPQSLTPNALTHFDKVLLLIDTQA